MSINAIATEVLACRSCGADAGDNCRTKSGHRASWPHAARTNAASTIWVEGYRDGVAEWTKSVLEIRDAADLSRAQAQAQREYRWASDPEQ